MPSFLHPQTSPADVRRSASQGYLVIAEAPAAASALVGMSLQEAGVIDAPGTYVCYIDTHDWSTAQVTVKASDVVSTIPVTLDSLYHDRLTVRDSVNTAALTTSAQELELTGLLGTQRCRVTFVLGSGDSMTFDAVTALAEFNGQ